MRSNKSSWHSLIFALGSVWVAGCAFDLVHVKQLPAELRSTEPPKESWILSNQVEASLGTGFQTRLKAGTRWDYVGTVEQGDVFKTKDQVLTVEGSNIFEAYIVVSDGKLVGFYLPVEGSYSPLSKPRALQVHAPDSTQP